MGKSLSIAMLYIMEMALLSVTASPCLRRVCVYSSESLKRRSWFLTPDDIDPYLCTHIIYEYAAVKDNSLAPSSSDDVSTQYAKGNYDKILSLKSRNSELKVLISVSDDGDFYETMSNFRARENFVQMSTAFLRRYKFDGLDLRLIYRGDQSTQRDSATFTRMLGELKYTFSRDGSGPKLLLTAGIFGYKHGLETFYKVPEIAEQVDWISLIVHDYGRIWTGFTAFPHPLRYGPWMKDPDSLTNNMEWQVNQALLQGVPKDKIVASIATFSRSYTVRPDSSYDVGIPATPGTPYEYTLKPGIRSHYEMCKIIHNHIREITDGFLPDKSRVLRYQDQWIGRVTIFSIERKIRFIKSKGLAGYILFYLDMDDFTGYCDRTKFPLTTHAFYQCLSK